MIQRKLPDFPKDKAAILGSVWCLAALIAAAVWVTWLSLVLAYAHYPEAVYQGYFENPLILKLNFFPVLALLLVVWGLSGRVTLSYGVTAAVILAGGIANCFKLKFRDDPVVFNDLTILSTGYDAAKSYEMVLTLNMQLVIALAVLGGVLLFLFLRKKRGIWPVRAAVIALAVLCVFATGRRYYLNEWVYKELTANPAMNNNWETTDFYVSKGFVYPFLHTLTDVFGNVPEGYDPKAAEKILAEYEDADIPKDKQVNIMAFQLEAFTDLRKLGVEGIHKDVYAAYEEILSESYSGRLMTNIFAGGTTDSEWSLLTGLTELPKFYGDTNSYVWYLKEQGYVTEGSHPCFSWYYNRANINPRLGFDDYLFIENHYNRFREDFPTYDYEALPEMLRLYREAAEGEAPVFHFNVTYQGHGPYYTYSVPNGDWYWSGEKYYSGLSEQTPFIMNNYLWSMMDTSQRMLQLLDELRNEEEPVVVLLYGDHKPWLGDYESVYHELGINLDVTTREGVENYYGTDYVIWANEAAKECIGHDFKGEGPAVGIAFLMNELFNQLGWKGDSYMQLMENVRQELQTISSVGYYLSDDALLFEEDLTAEQNTLLREMRWVQFDRQKNFTYGKS